MGDIEGASLFERGGAPTIVLNRRADRVSHRLARRAVLAHELCHLLHDSSSERDLVTVVSRSSDTSEVEQRASAFAPNFIAPKPWIRRFQGTAKQIVQRISEEWGLSFEGAAWHAQNIQRIPKGTAAKLRGASMPDTTFERDLPRLDPATLGLDLQVSGLASSALGDLAIEAARADVISLGRAAEILTLR